jgi:carbamoyltransferase
MRYPHSVGLLYTAFTTYAGFKANSGEYKLMGLAPYGRPLYRELIRDRIVDVAEDGSITLQLDMFDFGTGDRMFSERFIEAFGHPARRPEAPLTTFYMDVAASIQQVTEDIILAMARHLRRETELRALCMAGGVALNCVANARVLRSGLFDDVWIQPAAGDAGGAVGAALAAWHLHLGQPRTPERRDAMRGALLGPAYGSDEIRDILDMYGFPYDVVPDDEVAERVAELLADGRVVGLFQGRMEFGPRALGNRSILADARRQETQTLVNRRIKFRESFRPFAPAVLGEKAAQWFDLDRDAPYMLFTAPVHAERRLAFLDPGGDDVLGRLGIPRSVIPAVTHLDGSARVQTVHRDLHPMLHAVLEAFERRTGVPVLVNTSFNVRGEPIVCTPMDAYRCLMRTEIDCVMMENVLVWREKQPPWPEAPPGPGTVVIDC